MPHITAAMHRSVRRGVGDIVIESLLGRRAITDSVNNVKNTFSSWDNCMAQSYCKWPVIAAIIIGSLIVLSVVSCIVRCCCCGMSCCCSCFQFMNCCCGGACDGKKNKPMKHLDDPYAHHGAGGGGYHAPAPMPVMGAGFGKPEPPQYAQFEVGKNGLAVEPKNLNEDALPPMPSWDGAAKKHVPEEKGEAVELGELDPATGQKVPLMSGGAAPGTSMPPSPVHEMGAAPYGGRPAQGGGNGYVGVAHGDPYSQSNNSFNSNGGYADAAAPIPGRGFNSPPPGQGRGFGAPPSQDSYGYNDFNGAAGAGFDNQNRPYPPNSRQYSGNSRPMNQYSDRPYPSDNFNQPPRGPSRGPPGRVNSPPANDAGYNYGNDDHSYSRAPQQSYNSGRRPSPPMSGNDGYYEGSTPAPSYVSRSPPPQEPAYSSYQAYQQPSPQSNHQRAPTALRPGAGRVGSDRREPTQGWDPVSHQH